MKHIRSSVHVAAIVIMMVLVHTAPAFCATPPDTTIQKRSLIDSLKEGEVYKLVVSSFSCWTGSIFTMEITKKEGRYIVHATDTVMDGYLKLPRKRFGPALVSAAGLDSIRTIEAELANPVAHSGERGCQLTSNYIITLGAVQKKYIDRHCLYPPQYRERLTWLMKDWAVRSVVL